MLAGPGPPGLVRRIPHPSRHQFPRERRRGGHAARPQRRRQDHDAEVDHGHHRQAHRLDPLQRQDIIRASSDRIARMGIAFCPEERGIFASLDVRENLLLPPIVRPGGLSLDQIFDLFPNLKERLEQPGHQAFRRRAADAGDRAHPAHRRELPDAGRADRGAGAGHHPADRPHHRAAEEGRASPSCWSSRISASPPPWRTATTSSSTARSSTASPIPSSQPTWTSCTPISASNSTALRIIGRYDETSHFRPFARHGAGACRGGSAFAQDKTIKIGVLTDKSGLYADLGGAGSTLAAQMAIEDSGMAGQGLEDRSDLRRSPEQARHRHHHRPAMDRRRKGRHPHGRAELRRRAGGQQRREGKERHHDQFRRGDVGSDQRAVLAQYGPLGLRHLHAGQHAPARRW